MRTNRRPGVWFSYSVTNRLLKPNEHFHSEAAQYLTNKDKNIFQQQLQCKKGQKLAAGNGTTCEGSLSRDSLSAESDASRRELTPWVDRRNCAGHRVSAVKAPLTLFADVE